MMRESRGIWLTLACAAAVAGCDKLHSAQPAAPPPAAQAPKAPEVFVAMPTSHEVIDHEDFTGRTVAIKTVDLRARVTGYLDKLNFKEKEGGDVVKGEVLFEIDPRPYEAEVARVEATIKQTEAHLARLELDHRRASNLVGSKSISREQFDQVNGDKLEAEAAVDVAKSNLRLAKLNLSFTKVRSPITGRVSRTQLDPGNLIKADDTILTTIVAIDPIYAYFEVDERTMLRIRQYSEEGRLHQAKNHEVPVEMGLANEADFPHHGSINFYDNRLDASTGTLQIRGEFPNPDRMLTPGLFVRVRLPVGDPYAAILVPEQALGTDQGQKFVYVIDKDNKAQYRRVKVGKLDKGERVIVEGLATGELVVVSGLQRVRPGAEVAPKPMQPVAKREESTAGVAKTEAGGSRAAQH